MMLTSFQVYLLECLQNLRCMRVKHLEWLLNLKFGSTPRQVESDIRQLQYMGLLCKKEGTILLPGCERDGWMLAAVDIMQLLSGTTLPEFSAAGAPAKLSFYLEDERGYLDFKVIPVLPAQERKIRLQIEAQLSHFICTCIFLIQNERQMELLQGIPRAYFALPDKRGGYQFLKAERWDAARK